jgi:peroxiredoxin
LRSATGATPTPISSRRAMLVRVAVAILILGALVWVLPVRRAGEDGGHHRAGHDAAPALDPFERAGVSEFKEGQRGPAFSLAALDGSRASLETWKGRLAILNFWATWCQPCADEMASLEALWRAYGGRGLVVIGASVDRGAPRPLIDPYVKNLGLTFPILLDPEMKTAGAWRVNGIPTTFVIRPGGEVAGMAVGPRDWNGPEMRALVEALLPGAHGRGAR